MFGLYISHYGLIINDHTLCIPVLLFVHTSMLNIMKPIQYKTKNGKLYVDLKFIKKYFT